MVLSDRKQCRDPTGVQQHQCPLHIVHTDVVVLVDDDKTFMPERTDPE